MANFATNRLQQDYLCLMKDPIPYIDAIPLPDNIFTWHYVFTGPSDSPFAGGIYHGKIIFPPEFPFKPPGIVMITPNGKFIPNQRICLTMSDAHPELWNPAWNASTILNGLLSFMLEAAPFYGHGHYFQETKEMLLAMQKRYAYNSLKFNLRNEQFSNLFPDHVIKIKSVLEQRRKNGEPEELTEPVKPETESTNNGTAARVIIPDDDDDDNDESDLDDDLDDEPEDEVPPAED